jgi:hypothetical protein
MPERRRQDRRRRECDRQRDCGFSSQACYKTEVHPKVIWEKFKALSERARLASRQMWER